jgi:FMN reductase
VLKAINHYDEHVVTELVDLRDYEVEFVRGIPVAEYNQDTQDVISKLNEADVIVIGTPIYQASIPGVLKNVFDHLAPNCFKGKVVGIVTNGGSEKHFLMTEYQLKPILSYFKAILPLNNVFLHTSCFGENNQITNVEEKERIDKLAKELINLKKLY